VTRLPVAVVAATLVVCSSALAATPPKVVGNVKIGKSLFKAHQCSSCHNLAAANAFNSSGTGPDLDHSRKTYAQMITQITKGGKGMTGYGKVLTTAQIQDLAAFVYLSAHNS
jgi:mono/diheme cytochrome c family protein